MGEKLKPNCYKDNVVHLKRFEKLTMYEEVNIN